MKLGENTNVVCLSPNYKKNHVDAGKRHSLSLTEQEYMYFEGIQLTLGLNINLEKKTNLKNSKTIYLKIWKKIKMKLCVNSKR